MSKTTADHALLASTNPLPRWAYVALLTATVLVCAVPYSLNLPDPDLWGHVQYGQDWLESGQLPRTASHTFTAVGYPWINHENLAELSLALGYEWLGMRGLLIAKCALGIVLSLLLIRNAERARASLPVICGTLLLVAGALHVFWLLRPQLATFLGLATWVLLFSAAFRTWHEDRQIQLTWLWCYPLVQWAWTNSHGGFLAGWVLMACYTGGRVIELWLTPLPSRCGNGDGVKRRCTWHLVAVTIASMVVMFVNPYGMGLVRWLVRALSRPRPEIVEWGKPDLLVPMFWPYFALLLLTVAGWLFSNRRKDWVHAFVLVLMAWQSLQHIRHIGIFVTLTAFWSVPHFEALSEHARRLPRERWNTWVQQFLWPRRLGVISGFAAILLSAVIVVPLAYRVAWLPVDRAVYPVDAISFMQQHDLNGKLVVSFNWAQYAIAAMEPHIQVAFDGRFRTCYPQQLIDMHFDWLLGDVPHRYRSPESGPIDPHRVLHHGEPDLVLVDRAFPHGVSAMQQQDLFVLLYQDGLAQLWGRRSLFDDPRSARYFPPSQRQIGDALPHGHLAWPALVGHPHLQRRAS